MQTKNNWMDEFLLPISPISWYCGNQDTFIVELLAFNSLTIKERLWPKFPCEIMTPLGSEVDPDVYCKKAVSVSVGINDRDGPVVLEDAFSFPFARTSSTTIHRNSGHFRFFEDLKIPWMSDTFFAKLYIPCVIATVAPELFCILIKWCKSFCNLLGSGGNTGTAIMPALKQAIREDMKWSPGKNTSSARSPAFNLEEFKRKDANDVEARSSSYSLQWIRCELSEWLNDWLSESSAMLFIDMYPVSIGIIDVSLVIKKRPNFPVRLGSWLLWECF